MVKKYIDGMEYHEPPYTASERLNIYKHLNAAPVLMILDPKTCFARGRPKKNPLGTAEKQAPQQQKA